MTATMALVLLVKATALLLVALAASLLLQRASAGSRHLVWLVAVVRIAGAAGGGGVGAAERCGCCRHGRGRC